MVKSYYEEIKTATTNFDEKYITCKNTRFLCCDCFFINYYIIMLTYTISIYCYLISYQTKNSLPFHDIKI